MLGAVHPIILAQPFERAADFNGIAGLGNHRDGLLPVHGDVKEGGFLHLGLEPESPVLVAFGGVEDHGTIDIQLLQVYFPLAGVLDFSGNRHIRSVAGCQ